MLWATAQAQGPRDEQQDAFHADGELFLVCDGMGGHDHGALAAAAARDAITANPDDREFFAANEAIARISDGRPFRRNPGTTATALRLHPDGRAVLTHIGDSRCYRLRDGVLLQLTRDHAWSRYGLDRCLMGRRDDKPDVHETLWHAGDRYLLCSDGVHGVWEDFDLHAALTSTEELATIAERLVNGRELTDNATVVIVEAT